jgi:hypothetical protein
LVLENIENNLKLNAKPHSVTKSKGADGKRKMEWMDSRIPKKPKRVGWTDKRIEAWRAAQEPQHT